MSPIQKTYWIFRYYFVSFYRSRSFYFMLSVITIAGAMLTYLTMKYFLHYSGISIFQGISSLLSEQQILGFIWTYVGSYIPVFAAVFFGSSAISGEIESRSAYSVFPLPVSRTSLMIGKYFASLLAGFLIVIYYYAFFAVNSIIVLGTLDAGTFMLSLALSLAFLSSLLSLTYLVSTLFNRATYSYITVFIIYFLIFTALNYVIQLLYNYFPFYLLNNTSTVISRVYLNFNPSSLFLSQNILPLSMGEAILYTGVIFAYTFICFIAAVFIFQEKEVK